MRLLHIIYGMLKFAENVTHGILFQPQNVEDAKVKGLGLKRRKNSQWAGSLARL